MTTTDPRPATLSEGLGLFAERDFTRLFAARLVSAFGTAMAPVAMAFGVLDLTGSATAVGLVVAAQAGAQVLFQLLGGALADRGSRQRMIVLADLLAMTSQGTMAALFFWDLADVPTLSALMGLNGVAFALHWPAAVGLLPQVVERDRLQSANGLLSLAQSAAIGLGAATAGVLVATVGAGWAIAVDANPIWSSIVRRLSEPIPGFPGTLTSPVQPPGTS